MLLVQPWPGRSLQERCIPTLPKFVTLKQPDTILIPYLSSTMNLTLPPACPALGLYGDYDWSNSSFALYTLVSTDNERMQQIANALDAEWYENQGNQGSHLVRVAPVYNFSNKTLSDILGAHVKLHKLAPGQSKSQYGVLDLEWYPTAFIVVTAEDIDNRGLLFVFVVDEEGDDDEVAECKMDKFLFKQKDANRMLSTLIYDDDTAARAKEIYGYWRLVTHVEAILAFFFWYINASNEEM